MEIDREDPLSRFVSRYLGLSTGRVLVLMLLYAFVWLIILPLSTKLFYAQPMQFPPSYGDLALGFVEIPIIWAFYIWSRQQIPQLFASIPSSDLLLKERDKARFSIFWKETEGLFNRILWTIIGLSFAIGFSVLTVLYFWENNTQIWFEPKRFAWYAGLVLVTYTLNQYIVFMVVIREILTAVSLHRLFDRFEIRVHLYAADSAGGWGQVGRHAAGLSVFVVAIAVWAIDFSFFSFSTTPTSPFIQSAIAPLRVAVWLALATLAPLLYTVLVWSTHRAMQVYRNRILMDISAHINKLVDEQQGYTLTGDLESSQQSLDRLELHKSRRQLIVDGLATWPFPTRALSRLVPLWLLPILSVILSTSMEEVIKSVFP